MRSKEQKIRDMGTLLRFTMSANEDTIAISVEDVEIARENIRGVLQVTPVLQCHTLSDLFGANLYFKCENFQTTGSFKVRGAYNALIRHSPKAVTTYSTGNFASALAWAATKRGIPSYEVMYETAPPIKIRTAQAYGGSVISVPNSVDAREAKLKEVIVERNAMLIHTSNDPHVIAGQATVSLEFMEQVSELEVIVVPVGGGGLAAGSAFAIKHHHPHVQVVMASPELCDAAYLSVTHNYLMPHSTVPASTPPPTIADGLTTTLSPNALPILRKYLDATIMVSEESIRYAMRLVWERMKVVAEPSGVVSVAAALSPQFKKLYGHCKHVGVVISGGNVNLDTFDKYLAPVPPMSTSSSSAAVDH